MRDKIIDKIYDLYVINTNKYLIQKPGGEYTTITYRKNKGSGAKPLLPFIIEQHLDQKKTVGVFAGSYYSKFICFDVDFRDRNLAKWITYKITKTLSEMGISEYYISNSGSKGYHIEIFIDDLIPVTTALQFYNLVINKAEVFGYDGEVEFRPTKQQGLKLPLGINQKSGDYCGFCLEFKGLKLIEEQEEIEYFLNVCKIKRQKILDILNLSQDYLKELEQRIKQHNKNKTLKKEIQQTEEQISQHRELDIYNPSEEFTIKRILNYINHGLSRPGTRHNVCFNIARFFNHNGMEKEDAKQKLKDWMKKQDKGAYSSTLPEALKDIEEIIEYVFTKNIGLSSKKKDISVSFNEINEIIVNCPKKNQKLLAYAMLIHSKRFATVKDGVFYMTFKQMQDATGLTDKTVRTIINQLEELGVIEVVERNGKNMEYNKLLNKPISKPNKYKMNLISEGECIESISDDIIIDFKNTILNLYDKKDIKKLLTRREYDYFIKC